MALALTTPAAIRKTVGELVINIAPTQISGRAHGWHLLPHGLRPRGTDTRNFCVITGVAEMDDRTFGCDSLPKIVELGVVVSYGGLEGNDFSDMVNQDQSDIWRAISPLPGGNGIAGVISMSPLQIEVDYDPEDLAASTVEYITQVTYQST